MAMPSWHSELTSYGTRLFPGLRLRTATPSETQRPWHCRCFTTSGCDTGAIGCSDLLKHCSYAISKDLRNAKSDRKTVSNCYFLWHFNANSLLQILSDLALGRSAHERNSTKVVHFGRCLGRPHHSGMTSGRFLVDTCRYDAKFVHDATTWFILVSSRRADSPSGNTFPHLIHSLRKAKQTTSATSPQCWNHLARGTCHSCAFLRFFSLWHWAFLCSFIGLETLMLQSGCGTLHTSVG